MVDQIGSCWFNIWPKSYFPFSIITIKTIYGYYFNSSKEQKLESKHSSREAKIDRASPNVPQN